METAQLSTLSHILLYLPVQQRSVAVQGEVWHGLQMHSKNTCLLYHPHADMHEGPYTSYGPCDSVQWLATALIPSG